LVSRQDELIETQNAISDQIRRQGDRDDLTDVMKELRRLEEAHDKEAAGKTEIPKIFEKRVIRLTNSFTPYAGIIIYTKIEGVGLKPIMTLRDRPASPERATILRALLDARAMTEEIRNSANFTFADFSDETLKDYDFSGLNLQFSDFRGALVANCKFVKAHLDDADLSSYHNDYRSRIVRPSGSEDAITLFRKCDFRSASLKRTKFKETHCNLCSFASASAIDGDFEGAKLAICRFDGSIFQNCDFDQAEISQSIMPSVTFTSPSPINSHITVESDLASYNPIYAVWTNCTWSRTIFQTVWVGRPNWSDGLPNGLGSKLKVSKAPETNSDSVWLDQQAEPVSWLVRGGIPNGFPYLVETEEAAQ
jgi:uncharacterized protein YjbI with pentapeptide repeats